MSQFIEDITITQKFNLTYVTAGDLVVGLNSNSTILHAGTNGQFLSTSVTAGTTSLQWVTDTAYNFVNSLTAGQIIVGTATGATILPKGNDGQILTISGTDGTAQVTWANPLENFTYKSIYSSVTIANTTQVFTTAITLNTPTLVTFATYRAGWFYEWQYSTNTQTGTNGFIGQINFGPVLSSATILSYQHMEPHYAAFDNVPLYGAQMITNVSGINTLTLQYCSGAAATTASIGRRMLEFWRVS